MMRDDSPAPAHLDDALELAEILRPTWPAISEENRRTAAFLNEGEEELEEDGDQSSPGSADSPEGNNGESEGNEASFLDAYDLGEVEDPQGRAVAEAFIKRMQGGYTRQRQQDTQAVQEAQQSQQILDGLMDPDRAPAILQALHPDRAAAILAAFGEQAPAGSNELGDFEFEDPNERIDRLERQLSQQNELSAAEKRTQAENAYVTEQIEGLEDKLGIGEADQPGFVKEEIELLYLLADENRDQSGAPDVEAANRLLDAAVASRSARIAKRPRVPRRPGRGSAGERQVDLSNREERLKAGAAAVADIRASAE